MAVPWHLATHAPASVGARSVHQLVWWGRWGVRSDSFGRRGNAGYETSGNHKRATAAVMRYGCRRGEFVEGYYRIAGMPPEEPEFRIRPGSGSREAETQ